ncbi:CapA family protein [Azohydromonas lata]|uniref:CapA family protein n=1 Tax=Azohydromonas lata TaxID=45677 RepID=UPI00083143BF|nr:CapA family protein [Azohydromonas lata]
MTTKTTSGRATLVGVGDVMIARYDATLLDPAAPVLQAADFTFGNCEWPYAEEAGDTHPVEAHLNDDVEGEDLFTPGDPQAIRLKAAKGFDVLSFANNHSMHAGYRVFLRSMELMRESGIAPVGAGRNIAEALAPVVLERNGVKVAFVGCTAALLPGAHAGRRTPGVAPLRRHSYFHNPNWNDWGLAPQVGTLVDRKDLAAVCASISAAREQADIVVLSVHWGLLEDRVAIGDYQREAARACIDHGADLILGHGTLVTKGIEVYKGKVVFYSLGKFLMKGPRDTGDTPIGVRAVVGKDKRRGLAARIDIEQGRIARVAFTPVLADEATRPSFLDANDALFGEIADETEAISAAAGLQARFTRMHDRVVIS